MIDTTAAILAEIAAERAHQDAKWGEQNHPDISGRLPLATQMHHGVVLEHIRGNEARARETGTLGWDLILLEEVYEALAEADPTKLRAELIQVAAVAVAWIAAIDRRTDP